MATFRGVGDPTQSSQFPSAEALAQAVADAEDAEANALSSAAAAASSASDAQAAQTAAETAQTAAETAETNAATTYDNFDDRYLGDKASDPTLDNDGDALVTGALYFNTTDNEMRVYNGTAWQPYVTHTLTTYQYTASASQTAFTGADDNTNTLDLANDVIYGVYLNGIMLQPTVDYTYTSTTVTLVVGAALNDVLQVVAADDTIVAGDFLRPGNNLSDVSNAATARSNLSAQQQDAVLDDIAGLTLVKGDVLVYNGTDIIKVGVGTNDQVLTADSAEASGVKWADAAGGSLTHLATFNTTGTGTLGSTTAVPAGTTHVVIAMHDIYMTNNGTRNFSLQLGTGGTPTWQNAGGGFMNALGSAVGAVDSNDANANALLWQATQAADHVAGIITLQKMQGTDNWVMSGTFAVTNTAATNNSRTGCFAGSWQLGAALTAIQFVIDTDSFGGGTADVFYV